MDKIIDKIVDKNLKNDETVSIQKIDDINIEKIYNRLIVLENENEKLKTLVDYNDANIKANYLLSIIGMLYFVASYLFDFSQILKISNLVSTLIVISILALFFFKENSLIVKHLFKKIL